MTGTVTRTPKSWPLSKPGRALWDLSWGLLQIGLVLAKWGGFIDWSWFWVFFPVWGWGVFALLLLIIAAATQYHHNWKEDHSAG